MQDCCNDSFLTKTIPLTIFRSSKEKEYDLFQDYPFDDCFSSTHREEGKKRRRKNHDLNVNKKKKKVFDDTKVNGIKYGPEWQERRLSEVVTLLQQVKQLEGTPMVPKLCDDAINQSTELCNKLAHAAVNFHTFKQTCVPHYNVSYTN